MGLILAARDIGSDIGGVKNTFSSWDKCMEKAYCKWPVIVAIIVGALIVFSILSCIVRCLCCGVECCCGCLSCCNACCPSPRRSRKGYEQQPPVPQTPYQQYPTYSQYQQPQPPAYASGGLGYRSTPQTATFDAPTHKPGAYAHADSLPAMPTWDTAHTRRVEAEDDRETEDVELEKLVSRPSPQPTSPWHQETNPFHAQQSPTQSGIVGAGGIAGSNNHYQSPHHQPYAHSPYSRAQDTYASDPYESYDSHGYNNNNNSTSYQSYNHNDNSYHAQTSTYPPSYATAPSPRVASPPAAAAAMRPPSGLQIGRKPLQGSWREI